MKTSSLIASWCGLVLGVAAYGEIPGYRTAPSDSQWQTTRLIETSNPIFPNKLVREGVTSGNAQVAISVDSDGKLKDALIVGCTDPEFGASALEAIGQWKFVPARLRGEPVGTTFDVDIDYRASGVVVMMCGVDLLPSYDRSTFGTSAYHAFTPRELDRTPEPLTTVAPAYPKAYASKGIAGVVTVEFYIDETGSVRMPCGSREDDIRLSSLAIGALRQWKFAPPVSHGKPVLVRATQSFNFTG